MKKYNLLLLAIILVTSLGAQTKKDYNLLVHQKDGQQVTLDAAEIDSISFMKLPPINTGDDFSIEVDEITSSSLNVKFTPKDNNITYYACLTDQLAFDRAWDEYGSIYEMDKGWWQYLAEVYSKSWLEILPSQVSKGPYTMHGSDDYGFILWDHTYYAYCYGLDAEGQITTPYYIKQYKTPKPNPSRNVLTIESITPGDENKVKVKINQSNEDQYYVCAQKKSYVDYYVESLGSVDAMFKNLIMSMNPTQLYLHNGSKDIELYCGTSNADYVLIVCGYDGGPTTAIQLKDFKTK